MSHPVASPVIPYGRQDINDDDIAAVTAVLRSDFLTQGPAVPAFEDAVRDWCGAGFAVAVNSATSALHLACLALDLGPGCLLWTVPNTFVASANCALYCGAGIDFVDIDQDSGNISVPALALKLKAALQEGARLPDILVVVHFAGQPADMAAIHAIVAPYGIRIIEDASHAVGAYNGSDPVGGCQYSDITVFSFHPVKIVTSAEGGMATTNDPSLAEAMRLLRSHGITREPGQLEFPSPGPWYYEQQQLGFNYRMTDVLAALGRSQMTRLEEMVGRRQEIAAFYDGAFAAIDGVSPLRQLPGRKSAWHLYVVRVDAEIHRDVFTFLRDRGILVNLHYMPVHLQPYYRRLGFTAGSFPNAEAHGTRAISLPMFPTLAHEQQVMVVDALAEAVSVCAKKEK